MTAPLTPAQEVLLGAIRAHLARLDTTYGFAARLASENRWTPQFSQYLVEEYAKFLFIAREGGHPVSPSPIIDKAWHLHLVHSEEYWGELCPKILKMELHHSPARKFIGEQTRLENWAAQTRQSYQRFFGKLPTIWLDSAESQKIGAAIVIGLLSMAFGFIFFISGGTAHALSWEIVGAFAFLSGGVIFITALKAGGPRGPHRSKDSCGNNSCGGDSGTGGHDGGHGGGHGCGGHGCGGGGGH